MIAIIAAVAKNRVIGSHGKIPWHIAEDFRKFKSLTKGNVVIMGRRTFESIGRPLPDRTNVVVSATMEEVPGIIIARSLRSAISRAQDRGGKIFICGGARLYEEGIAIADTMYISHVKGDFDGDTLFPDYDESEWEKVSCERFDDFMFCEYRRAEKGVGPLAKVYK